MWTQPQKSPFTLSQRKRLGILKKHFGVWPKTPKRFWLNASMFFYTSIHAFIYILQNKMYDLTTIRCYILLQQDVTSSGKTPSWNGERRKKGLPSPKLSDLQFVSLRWKEWMHLIEFPRGGLFYAIEPPTMSSNSLVMACWRVLLYIKVSSWSKSSALSVAICIAMVRAACSDAFESSKAV